MKKESEVKDSQDAKGLTRRGFLTTVGAGAVALAASGRIQVENPAMGVETVVLKGETPVTLLVNNTRHRLLVEPRWSLLYVLREQLGLIGTKNGCERGNAGPARC